MSRNVNPITQLLVTDGNQAVAAAGAALSALALHKIGVYNRATNLAIDGTNLNLAKEWYIAVGIDADGDGAVDDVARSAGQSFQLRNLKGYTVRCYTPHREQITDVTLPTANCDTEYGLKVNITMPQSFVMWGYNDLIKNYVYKTSCCEGCDCPSGDCKEVGEGLRDAINADGDGLLTAILIDPADVADLEAAALSDEDLAALEGCPIIRITTVTTALKAFCGIPYNLTYPNGFAVNVGLGAGFSCGGSVNVAQEMIQEEGSGASLARLKYLAGGWNGNPGPYRITESGVVLGSGEANALLTNEDYFIINLTGDYAHSSGFLEYENPIETVIAIPCADTTTRDGLLTVLDRLAAASNLPPMATIASGCAACNTPNTTGTHPEIS